MRIVILVAALLLAVAALPATSEALPGHPVLRGTTAAARGTVHGAEYVGRVAVRGTESAARTVGRGVVCLVSLGRRC
jgi:hypothetical protein